MVSFEEVRVGINISLKLFHTYFSVTNRDKSSAVDSYTSYRLSPSVSRPPSVIEITPFSVTSRLVKAAIHGLSLAGSLDILCMSLGCLYCCTDM